jgi:cytochrome c553
LIVLHCPTQSYNHRCAQQSQSCWLRLTTFEAVCLQLFTAPSNFTECNALLSGHHIFFGIGAMPVHLNHNNLQTMASTGTCVFDFEAARAECVLPEAAAAAWLAHRAAAGAAAPAAAAPAADAPLVTHCGRCHCGAVRFEVR